MLSARLSSTIIAIGALAAVAFVPTAKGPVFRVSPLESEAAAAAADPVTSDDRLVRVVYAPSNASPSRVADAAPAADPSPTPAPAPTAAPDSTNRDASAVSDTGTVTQANIDAVLQSVSRININTASIEDLDEIPGGGRIGRAIVRGRPYETVEDLLNKHVLRRSTYDRIRDEVAAD